MTAPALLRQLAEPALDAFANTVTVTVPTRLLTALADLNEAARSFVHESLDSHEYNEKKFDKALVDLRTALAEVERAAKEHTSQ